MRQLNTIKDETGVETIICVALSDFISQAGLCPSDVLTIPGLTRDWRTLLVNHMVDFTCEKTPNELSEGVLESVNPKSIDAFSINSEEREKINSILMGITSEMRRIFEWHGTNIFTLNSPLEDIKEIYNKTGLELTL